MTLSEVIAELQASKARRIIAGNQFIQTLGGDAEQECPAAHQDFKVEEANFLRLHQAALARLHEELGVSHVELCDLLHI
jgi:hypothetical protein